MLSEMISSVQDREAAAAKQQQLKERMERKLKNLMLDQIEALVTEEFNSKLYVARANSGLGRGANSSGAENGVPVFIQRVYEGGIPVLTLGWTSRYGRDKGGPCTREEQLRLKAEAMAKPCILQQMDLVRIVTRQDGGCGYRVGHNLYQDIIDPVEAVSALAELLAKYTILAD